MKSGLKTCSHGTACNFIHCFHNPGGDYEWADWDNPPPKYWVKKMAALFGPSDGSGYDRDMEPEIRGQRWNTSKKITENGGRYHSRRSRSRDVDWSNRGSGRDQPDHYSDQQNIRSGRQPHLSISRKERGLHGEGRRCKENLNFEDDRHYDKNIAYDKDSGGDYSDRDTDKNQCNSRSRTRSSRQRRGKNFSDDRGKFAGKHRQDEYKRYKEKDSLPSHSANGKYSDACEVQNHSCSSRREHSSSQIKEADFLDEHVKSEEGCESDSPGRYDGRCKSHDHDSGHYSDESIDQRASWKTVTSSPDEHEKLRCGFDDCKKENKRNKSCDNSGGHYIENRSRWSRPASHKTHSNSQRIERDSSDGNRA